MKIGYLTDTHIRSETPEGRVDNFNKSIIVKLEEAGQIFRDAGCELILHGGDWGDRPDIPYSVYNDLARIIKNWQLPVIGIIGSHDYYGYEIKSLKRTAVGALYASGIVELIGSKDMQPFIELEDIVICGNPHTHWLDEKPENYFIDKLVEGKFQIQLTHGTLLEKPAIFQHILIKDVHTRSNIVLGAHYHPGWSKVINQGATYFAGPGALARLSNTGVYEIPKVLIIDTCSITDMFKFVTLKSAIPNPFKEKLKEIKEEIPLSLVNRALDLIQATQVNIVDIKTQLPIVARELGFTKDIINEAFDLIEEASKEK